jgi:hypothetical protein
MQNGSSEALISWKSGKPLTVCPSKWDRMEGTWIWTLNTFNTASGLEILICQLNFGNGGRSTIYANILSANVFEAKNGATFSQYWQIKNIILKLLFRNYNVIFTSGRPLCLVLSLQHLH